MSDPTIVDCTMSDGTETMCYEILIEGVPADSAVGPFCPQNISSTSADSGIWLDGSGTVHEADGLDQCRGISDETRGYHYHAASASENMFIGCFTGKTVASDEAGPGGPPQ